MIEAELAEQRADLDALTRAAASAAQPNAKKRPAPAAEWRRAARRRADRTSRPSGSDARTASASDGARSPRSAACPSAEPQERQRGARHRVPRLLLGRAEEGPMARPRDTDPGFGGDPPLHRRRGGLPRRAGRGLQLARPAICPLSSAPPTPTHNRATRAEAMFRWYVINTYSGHENKVKHNLEHRIETMGAAPARAPGRGAHRAGLRAQGRPARADREADHARLRAGSDGDDRRRLGPGQEHPGVTGFVGSRNKPIPLSQPEVDRLLHRETAERPRSPRAVRRSARRSRSSPGRCRTSPARSPRSTRTRRSSRCWSRSSAARRRSRWAMTR